MRNLSVFMIGLVLLSLLGVGFISAIKKKQVEKNIPMIEPYLPTLLKRGVRVGTPQEQEKIVTYLDGLLEQLKEDPENVVVSLQLVQLCMLEARVTGEHGYYYPVSLKLLERVLKSNRNQGERFQALLLKASVLASLHRFDEAKAAGTEALKLNSHNALVHGTMVDANVELGDYEEAMKHADKMVGIRPDLHSYARISYLREIHGNIDGAIEAMKMAVAAGGPGQEDHTRCRLTLGKLYETYGKLDQAEAEYNLVLSERPDYPFAIAALANIEAKRRNYDKSLSLLSNACDIIPEVGFYTQKASVLLKVEREKEAQETLEEVLEMLADDEEHGHVMNLEYADVYLNLLNSPTNALTYAQKAYQARPENVDVNQMMAAVYYDMGKYDLASVYIQRAKKTGSQNPKLLCLEGLIEVKQGNESKGTSILCVSQSYDPHQNHSLFEEARKYL